MPRMSEYSAKPVRGAAGRRTFGLAPGFPIVHAQSGARDVAWISAALTIVGWRELTGRWSAEPASQQSRRARTRVRQLAMAAVRASRAG